MAWLLDHHDGLPYRVSLPPGYDPARRYPLVVYLHGSGERGDDTRRHLGNGVRALEGAPLVAVAPQCPAGDTFGGSWYGGATPTQRRVEALVDALAARRSVDAARISLVGFSMGAIGLWDLLRRRRGRFAAAVPIAGDQDPAWADALADVPIWAFHGELDPLVPNAAIREVAARLAPRGGPFRYTELPGVGHDAWRGAFGEPALLPWLLAQRRPA